jgi:hypothetical protein
MIVVALTPDDMFREPIWRSLIGHYDVYPVFYGSHDVRDPGNAEHLSEEDILGRIVPLNPDVVVFFALPVGHVDFPRYELFDRIREKCPVVYVMFDPPMPDLANDTQGFRKDCKLDRFDVFVNVNGRDDWEHRSNEITLLCPISDEFYKDVPDFCTRNNAIGFAGDFSPEIRVDYLTALYRVGLTVRGRESTASYSYSNYANFFMDTKVIVNTSFANDRHIHIVKARVVECGLAGSCLMEHKDSPAKKYFVPGVDYAEYGTIEECIDTAKYLMGNESYASSMAANLRDKIMKEHSSGVSWRRVFSKIGL